jgi:hypothetical protein
VTSSGNLKGNSTLCAYQNVASKKLSFPQSRFSSFLIISSFAHNEGVTTNEPAHERQVTKPRHACEKIKGKKERKKEGKKRTFIGTDEEINQEKRVHSHTIK